MFNRLKGDEQQETASSQEKKELKEDEVDTGMEMEADFEGEKFDLPDQPEDNDNANSENEEEVDRGKFFAAFLQKFGDCENVEYLNAVRQQQKWEMVMTQMNR